MIDALINYDQFDDADVLFPMRHAPTRHLTSEREGPCGSAPPPFSPSRGRVHGVGDGRQLFADTAPQLISSVCLF